MGVIKKVFKGKGGKEMIWSILLLIVSTIALAIIVWYEQKENTGISLVWFTIMYSCVALGSLFTIINYNEPTALDVYRGKTTLEITYRDSVAIDSTVVYK